jgi:hypothetical protein
VICYIYKEKVIRIDEMLHQVVHEQCKSKRKIDYLKILADINSQGTQEAHFFIALEERGINPLLSAANSLDSLIVIASLL